MKTIRSLAGLIVSLLALVLLLPFLVQAQSAASSVRLRPAIIENTVDPGKSLAANITVTNLSNSPQTYYLLTRDIIGVNDQSQPVFPTTGQESEFELASWIKVPAEPVTLNPGNAKDIAITIAVPPEARPGSHFASVFVSSQPPQADQTGSTVGYEVGTLVSIRVAGDVSEDAAFREFRANHAVYSTPHVTFVSRVENLGNTLIRPFGPLEITDMFGRKVATLTMNQSAGGVFPQTVREFTTEWPGNRFAFGRYEAIVSLAYGQAGSQTITATTSFWVLPLKFILPALGLIVLFVLVLLLGVKWYVRQRVNQVRKAVGPRASQARSQTSSALSGPPSFTRFVVTALIAVVVAVALLILLLYILG